MMSTGAALLTAAIAAITAFGWYLFQDLAPKPYMDEIFHVPQTQRYCVGHWTEWDEKITTFPGLYLLGWVLARAVGSATDLLGWQVEACGTAVLRSVNAIFAVACVPLFYHLAKASNPQCTEGQALTTAAACSLFPLHYFFSFLYYTDVPSAFFTLAAYLATKCRRGGLAAVLAAAAVLLRQTNAVWVAFMAGEGLLEQCLPPRVAGGQEGEGRDRSAGQGGGGASGRSRISKDRAKEGAGPAALPAELLSVLQRAWVLRWVLFRHLWGLAAVALCFAGFVVWNGGVVVGDRANHQPVRHLVQPLYFALYATAWLAPLMWTPAALRRGLAAAASRDPFWWAGWVAACAVIVAAVRGSTLVHPFLLADNRHYTFYLWRKLLNRRWWVRYALVPAYAYSLAMLAGALKLRGTLWVVLFAASTCLVLVPAHLVELRYFTIPFFLLFLNLKLASSRQVALVAAVYGAVNCLVIAVYLGRPFQWPDGSTARFLW